MNMSVRCLFFGKYTSDIIKGILSGSNHMTAIKAVVEAAGCLVNMVSFTRGSFDVIVDMNLPSQGMMFSYKSM
jgi:uncharacterized protein with GYD domain